MAPSLCWWKGLEWATVCIAIGTPQVHGVVLWGSLVSFLSSKHWILHSLYFLSFQWLLWEGTVQGLACKDQGKKRSHILLPCRNCVWWSKRVWRPPSWQGTYSSMVHVSVLFSNWLECPGIPAYLHLAVICPEEGEQRQQADSSPGSRNYQGWAAGYCVCGCARLFSLFPFFSLSVHCSLGTDCNHWRRLEDCRWHLWLWRFF